ncbi:MAG: ABC transporter permease subunit [Clostridiales bacterium]|nr:ABC transporter permease subunit [Clostridiales bacterium]
MTRSKSQKTLNYFKRYWTLYLLLLVPVIYLIVFKYSPMANILVAFKNYYINRSVFDMPWADHNGFGFFVKAFQNPDFINAIRNTFLLNILDLVCGFPVPIILALILNELRMMKFKRVTQTILYMPHFLSWVIIASLSMQVFSTTGLVNDIIRAFGGEPVDFLKDPGLWAGTYIFLGIWQSMGWNTIIYLAAITGINPELYEAAAVDGAKRFRMMWHITLPGIRPTVVILLILSLGRILGSDFERIYAQRNPLVTSVSDVISVFVYNYGIRGTASQIPLGAAVGLFQSVVCVIFLVIVNAIAKRFGERGIL